MAMHQSLAMKLTRGRHSSWHIMYIKVRRWCIFPGVYWWGTFHPTVHFQDCTLIIRNHHLRGFSFLIGFQTKNPKEKDVSFKTISLFLKNLWLFFRWGPLPAGSWLGNHPTRKPPQWGVFLPSTWHPPKFCALGVHSWTNAPPLNL